MTVRNNPSKTSRVVAANMRREIAARGLTQTELAQRCGLTQARISEIIRPRRDLQLSTVETMALALGCGVADLLPARDLPARETLANIS